MTELEKRGTGAETTRARGRGRRWPALLGGLVIAAVKSEAVLKLIIHRGSLIAVLAVLLVTSVLRARPVGIAFATALLVAVLVGAHSFGLGVVLAALLMALFFAISTVLLARQNRAVTGTGG